MNIIEAVKWGGHIKRDGKNWRVSESSVLALSTQDLLAEDWEVEVIPITITRQQFWEAVADSLKEIQEFDWRSGGLVSPASLAIRLGFVEKKNE